jgi:hypothetical protein
MALVQAEDVLAYDHFFFFFYVVFAAQICEPGQTETPAFISLLTDWEQKVSGRNSRVELFWRVLPESTGKVAAGFQRFL